MKMRHFLFAAAAMLPSIVIASPQAEGGSPRMQRMVQMLEQRFAAADSNHDGKLSLGEAQAGMPHVAQHFQDIDTAHQGYVTLAEIEAYAASRTAG
ncbi:EF-hand domain-containing protein [Frateuria aurantia]